MLVSIAQWLDWCMYAYKTEFEILIVIAFLSAGMKKEDKSIVLSLIDRTAIAAAIWTVYCLMYQGLGVG